MNHRTNSRGREATPEPPELDVVIEIPRGGFLKRGSSGHVVLRFAPALPVQLRLCAAYVGLEGDRLDTVVRGPRLALGSRVRVKAWGAVMLTDRGMADDKLICSDQPVSAMQRRRLLRFFHFYAKCKGLPNLWRRRPRRNACEGWSGASQALARARPRDESWRGPAIEF